MDGLSVVAVAVGQHLNLTNLDVDHERHKSHRRDLISRWGLMVHLVNHSRDLMVCNRGRGWVRMGRLRRQNVTLKKRVVKIKTFLLRLLS